MVGGYWLVVVGYLRQFHKPTTINQPPSLTKFSKPRNDPILY